MKIYKSAINQIKEGNTYFKESQVKDCSDGLIHKIE